MGSVLAFAREEALDYLLPIGNTTCLSNCSEADFCQSTKAANPLVMPSKLQGLVTKSAKPSPSEESVCCTSQNPVS